MPDTPIPHLWLPYCQMKIAAPPQKAVRTEGARIYLEDGRELVDGIASWWTACHGYSHPHIVEAIRKQAETMPHIMFGGLVHEPAMRLAERLTCIAPPGLSRVFFCDSGSVSVEVAMKMAVQYWHNRGQPRRNKFLSFQNSYHGDTMGAMSVCDPEDSMHSHFNGYFPLQYHLPIPSSEYDFAEMDTLLDGLSKQIAGVIIEPLVQGAGGMKFHSADTLAEIHRITKKHGLLFIADEIATGFGRTGHMFACEEAGITPDIMCIGKALTGGALSLAATLATGEVFSAFYDDDPQKAFMHGPTYMANPLACAAANASLDLFEQEPRLKQVEHVEQFLHEALAPCRNLPGVADVRVKGAIGVVQLEQPDIAELRRRFLSEGVWIRPFGNIVYLMPAFTVTNEELETLTKTVKKVLST